MRTSCLHGYWRPLALWLSLWAALGAVSCAAVPDGPPGAPALKPETNPPPREAASIAAAGSMLANAPSNYVWIPPGHFIMGSPVTEEGRHKEEGPQTEVTLTKGFYMSKFLVTQGEYLALMGDNPSYCLGDTNRPAEATGWFQATNYCGKLTARERQAGRLPPNWWYRLPTEAEWEYACRAGTTTRFYYGDDPGYTNVAKHAWYHVNLATTNKPPGASYFVLGHYYQTRPVGQMPPNPWGLYDMHGLVSEWCQDWFGRYPGGAVTDPQGPPTGKERVIRNGSWLDNPQALRSAMRNDAAPLNVSGIYGFRPVLSPVPPAP